MGSNIGSSVQQFAEKVVVHRIQAGNQVAQVSAANRVGVAEIVFAGILAADVLGAKHVQRFFPGGR